MTTAHDDDELRNVSSLVHDAWVDMETVVYDDDKGELQVVLGVPAMERRESCGSGWFSSRFRAPLKKLVLRVRQATSAAVVDEHGIGWVTVTQVLFDPDASEVRIETQPPSVLTASVRALDVELNATGEDLGGCAVVITRGFGGVESQKIEDE